jgi:hypothetical protein
MKTFRVVGMPNSSLIRIYSERRFIQADPEYQRMSEIWTLEKRQLLIDSILNEYDIPKLYFHAFQTPKVVAGGRQVKYAIIDGRQRLETIWDFIDGKFALGDDFVFLEDSSIDAKGLTYSELSSKYLDLKIRFDGFTLPIMEVITDDVDLIEDMFVRLNEAVPTNAAEKRNAFGGPMAATIKTVSQNGFFKKKVPISNKRYQHLDISGKFLLLANAQKSSDTKRRIVDTKKAYLDEFVKEFKAQNLVNEAEQLESEVKAILERMSKVFIDRDSLLKTQAMCVVLFLVFLRNELGHGARQINRKKLVQFEKDREENRKVAQDDLASAKYELLEFDKMSLQGSNDAASVRTRLETLETYLDS